MSYKILIVDDEEQVRKMFQELLQRQQYIVKTSSSAEEAMDLLRSEDFDAVLLDIKLAGMSGLEALRQIKGLKPNLPVIMITGFGYDEELISKSKELGCSGYIGKNMPISQILSNFRMFLQNAQGKG